MSRALQNYRKIIFWLSRNSEHFMKLKLYTYANDLQSAKCSMPRAACSVPRAACRVQSKFRMAVRKKFAKYLGQSLNNAMRMRG